MLTSLISILLSLVYLQSSYFATLSPALHQPIILTPHTPKILKEAHIFLILAIQANLIFTFFHFSQSLSNASIPLNNYQHSLSHQYPNGIHCCVLFYFHYSLSVQTAQPLARDKSVSAPLWKRLYCIIQLQCKAATKTFPDIQCEEWQKKEKYKNMPSDHTSSRWGRLNNVPMSDCKHQLTYKSICWKYIILNRVLGSTVTVSLMYCPPHGSLGHH